MISIGRMQVASAIYHARRLTGQYVDANEVDISCTITEIL